MDEQQPGAGKPKPIRFTAASFKRIQIYAIERNKSFSAAVRELCDRGLAAAHADDHPAPRSHLQSRRVLSRGI